MSRATKGQPSTTHIFKMPQFIEFTAEEIDEFEEIEFQKKRENRLQYFIHGTHINPRHKAYCEQRKTTANSARPSSSSPAQQDLFTTRDTEKVCSGADSDSDGDSSCLEGSSLSHQATGSPIVAPVSLLLYSLQILTLHAENVFLKTDRANWATCLDRKLYTSYHDALFNKRTVV